MEKSTNMIIAENISKFRKQNNLTQFELSQKLNYSDKAVSKWERGESLPDIGILMQIADLFGVTINDLCYEQKTDSKFAKPKNAKTKHTYISILSVGIVWLVATIVFAMLLAFTPNLPKKWLAFIYAIPVTGIVLCVFNSVWGKRVFNSIFVSIIIWGVLLSVCLTANFSNINWLYLIGVPLEILTIIWYCFKAQITHKFSNLKDRHSVKKQKKLQNSKEENI